MMKTTTTRLLTQTANAACGKETCTCVNCDCGATCTCANCN